MSESNKFKIIYQGNVEEFEEQILKKSHQEVRSGKPGKWCKLADEYARQLTIISINPYPEEIEGDKWVVDETPPSIKHIDKNTSHKNFYRWGFQGGRTGNHRIIYAIHNFYKVILLYHFDKGYNGLIKRDDLIPAELNYEDYCSNNPNLY
ncbi:hypothetical protein CIL05_03280 [Virgibacillus profundi]|uniref:Uncharacterized protein n=1 Tax=Virgibacillus profundi TaxID=2024555 RepID=A0A2A2IHA4_9BACI|nr:hypothetical protein [Virgibacillus profundi]PAV30758.1 hypothetical protein CIL05_03280 [Virgibacillus profundi]PXY54941.1 hypothetical protein CIT14_03360 [Virgibacillus profundi]